MPSLSRDDRVAVVLSHEEFTLAESIRTLSRPMVVTRSELAFPGPTIVAVSAGVEALTGYAGAELVGRSPRIFQGPLTDRVTLDRLRATCARGERFEGETVNYRKGGAPFVMHWCIDPVRSETGEITHFIAVQEDVTDQRPYARQWLEAEAERRSALSRASEQLAAIAEAILVIEQTKHSFRSAQLGELRRRLSSIAAEQPLPERRPITRADGGS